MPSIGPESNSISNLKNEILSGKLHSPNKFHVEIFGPNGSLDKPYIVSVIVPGRGVKTQNEFLWGLERNIPIARQYNNDDFVLTLGLSDDFRERTFFEAWMNTMFNKLTPGSFGGILGNFISTYNSRPDSMREYADYAKDSSVVIKPLNVNGEPVAKFTLIEPYPSALLPISLTSASQNDFSRLEVKMGYKEYIYETI
tara:strand:+ start:1966 stop:2559 length:594 start_codon:yes stop_codon:yes gene_type:complete